MFIEMLIKNSVIQGCLSDAPFEEKLKAYNENFKEGMPSKRTADRYVFIKK